MPRDISRAKFHDNAVAASTVLVVNTISALVSAKFLRVVVNITAFLIISDASESGKEIILNNFSFIVAIVSYLRLFLHKNSVKKQKNIVKSVIFFDYICIFYKIN